MSEQLQYYRQLLQALLSAIEKSDGALEFYGENAELVEEVQDALARE